MPTKNGNGPTRQPRKKLLKKFAYTETIKLNNSTSEYAYYTKYVKPDITKATGAAQQFAAYELWRLRKMKVAIQMAQNSSNSSPASAGEAALNNATSSTVWTAADWGANETVSGVTIMQYQNAKKNTPSLNKWTNIVDTTCRVNAALNGSTNYSFIMPASLMLNTTDFNSNMYSGYQIFIQNFGTQNYEPDYQPAFTIITELEVEFLQPAFQNLPSTFISNAFGIRMVTIPDGATPTITRTYVFDKITVELDQSTQQRTMLIRLTREDGQSGSLTYTSEQLREAIASGTSGIYFGGRPIIYDGPFPPREIPEQDFQISTELS